jgi:hypothetical protein
MTEACRLQPPSYFVSLASCSAVRKISAALHPLLKQQTVVRHRVERTIAGRPFVIEVTWVAEKRWRAHILRIPGVPTAMMPFYGETPDEAATQLSEWLTRAHQYRANTV